VSAESSNQRKSGRFVCWPRLSAVGEWVQGGEGKNGRDDNEAICRQAIMGKLTVRAASC
jgi:hypothetical protein